MKPRTKFDTPNNTGNGHIPTKPEVLVSQFGPIPALNPKITRTN